MSASAVCPSKSPAGRHFVTSHPRGFVVTSHVSKSGHKETVDTTLLESASMSSMSLESRRRRRQRVTLTASMTNTTTVRATIHAVLANEAAIIGFSGDCPATCLFMCQPLLPFLLTQFVSVTYIASYCVSHSTVTLPNPCTISGDQFTNVVKSS